MIKINPLFGKEAEAALGHAVGLISEAAQEFKGKIPIAKNVLNDGFKVSALSGIVGAAVLHATPAGAPHMVDALMHVTHLAQHAPAAVSHAIQVASHLAPAVASAMTTATAMVGSKGVALYREMMNTGLGRLARATVAAGVHHAPVAEELLTSTSRFDRWAGKHIEAIQARAGNVHGVEEITQVVKEGIKTTKRVMHPAPDDAPMLALREAAGNAHEAISTGIRRIRTPMLPLPEAPPVNNPADLFTTLRRLGSGVKDMGAAIKQGLKKAGQHVTSREPVSGPPELHLDEAVASRIPLVHETITATRNVVTKLLDLVRHVMDFAGMDAKRIPLSVDLGARVNANLLRGEINTSIAAEAANTAISNGVHAARLAGEHVIEPHIVPGTKALEDIMKSPDRSLQK